jgi:hypothetical protein
VGLAAGGEGRLPVPPLASSATVIPLRRASRPGGGGGCPSAPSRRLGCTGLGDALGAAASRLPSGAAAGQACRIAWQVGRLDCGPPRCAALIFRARAGLQSALGRLKARCPHLSRDGAYAWAHSVNPKPLPPRLGRRPVLVGGLAARPLAPMLRAALKPGFSRAPQKALPRPPSAAALLTRRSARFQNAPAPQGPRG